jgi:hypothetical protein
VVGGSSLDSHAQARMAAFAPPHQVAANPLKDLPLHSPPSQNMFHPNNLPQSIPSTTNILESRPPHRLPDDYRSNGVPAYSNGDGALPVPGGPPPHGTNGNLRHRSATAGGIFEGPRSPPTTKSTARAQTPATRRRADMFRCRYVACAVQIFPIRAMPGRKSMPVLPLHRQLERGHTL